jgi:hypothetical protein
MPFFRSTRDILISPWEDEVFDPNWMDSDKVILPPRVEWDYKRELTIEDVDIWEQIYFASGCVGLYAAWMPYAEFYLITYEYGKGIETFYGPGSMKNAYDRAIQLGMHIPLKKAWVDDKDLWRYQQSKKSSQKIIFLPPTT